MFAYESVVGVLFRLINFAVLVGIFWYLFKQYGMPAITEQISERESLLQDLEDEKYVLVEKEREVDRVFDEQNKLCNILKQHINRWQEVVLKKQHVAEQEWKQQQKHIAHAMQERHKKLAAHRAQEAMIPQILDGACQKLQQKFASEEPGKEYLSNIMQHIHKELS